MSSENFEFKVSKSNDSSAAFQNGDSSIHHESNEERELFTGSNGRLFSRSYTYRLSDIYEIPVSGPDLSFPSNAFRTSFLLN